MKIEIAPEIHIAESELHFDFVRSSGSGGQNVNKVSTAVQLRFDVSASSISQPIKDRLRLLAGRRMTDAGIIIIEARRSRSQEQNRQDTIERLRNLLVQAEEVPKKRRKTKPTFTARKMRLAAKNKKSETKKMRKSVSKNNY